MTPVKQGKNPEVYLTVREAAQLLRLSEISVRRFLTLKKLKRFKAGARTLLLESEVRGLIKEMK
jgi:excisionase family DNA binding protein